MFRPKRAAAQKAKSSQDKNEEHDDSEVSEQESDHDFSSEFSEDDYNPEATNAETEPESNSDEGEDDDDSDEFQTADSDTSPVKTKSHKRNSSIIATLKGVPTNKYKTTSSSSILEILKRSQFQKRKSIFDETVEETTKEKTPEFDCSGGLRLSDSSSDEDESQPTSSKKAIEKMSKKKEALSSSAVNHPSNNVVVDLKSVHDNYQKLENDKAKMLNYNSAKQAGSQKENIGIADLLAMGEGESDAKPSQKRARQAKADASGSDDDWEEVEDESAVASKAPRQGVEIVLNHGDLNQRNSKQKKEVDYEAQLKRKFNRRRKEEQEILHKANLVCWIGHGNFVNRRINDASIMQTVLKLLPSKSCYPQDKTDLDYFKQITNWFKSTITLRNSNMYTEFKTRPPLLTSLALQIQMKKAICRRDYVLIFAILLRAMGVQCRVVQSLNLAPILPPKSDLISLSKRQETKSSGSTKSSSKRSSKKSRKSHDKSLTSKSKSSTRSKSSSQSKSSTRSKSSSSKSKSSSDKSKSSSSASKSSSSKSKSSSDKSKSSSSASKSSSDKSKSSSSASKSSSSKDSSKKSFATKNVKKSPEKSSSRSSRSKSKKIHENIPQLDGGDDQASTSSRTRKPLKLKALRGFEINESYVDLHKAQNGNDTFVETPTMKIQVDSPNRNRQEGSTEKLSKKVATIKEKEKLKVLSPRKTRSMSRDASPKPGPSSAAKENKPSSKIKAIETAKPNLKSLPAKVKPVQDTLQVLSPRRLRSRSRSNEKDIEVSAKGGQAQIKEAKKRPASNSDDVLIKKVKFSATTKRSAENSSAVEAKKPRKDDVDSDDSSKYFKTSSLKKKISTEPVPQQSTSRIDRRVLSTDSETDAPVSPSKKSKKIDIWVEVFSETEEKWLAIDVFSNKVDCVPLIVKSATRPMIYVFAWNNDNSIKDVSARYCQNLNTVVRKMRVNSKYLNSIMSQFAAPKTLHDRKEDDEFNQLMFDKPMPTTIGEFKNHPLYALKRHLLKYEALYPPEPPILGYIREEAIYPRDCVFVLHTRETWLKEAKVVKLNEEPYKITKTLKWDNVTKKLLKDVPQELFGIWQTKPYEPPVAENGIVPRNAYGNVELFKPEMLPIGCVHLQLPGLSKVCKKIGVDCSQAIIGFDSNGGWPFPVYDGFIICEEFQEKVLDAWNRDQEEQEKKQVEKYEKRVYGNWKKLIKGLLIRQRLKNKYNFEGTE